MEPPAQDCTLVKPSGLRTHQADDRTGHAGRAEVGVSDCHAGHGANHRLVAEEVHLVARSDLDSLPHAVVAGVRHVPVKGHDGTRRVRTAREPVGENHRAAEEGKAHALRQSHRSALGEIKVLHAGREEEGRTEPLGTNPTVLRNLGHHRQQVRLRHFVGRVTGSRHEGRGIGLAEKIRAYVLQDSGEDTVQANISIGQPVDDRTYEDAVDILQLLQIKSLTLLTNNPEKIATIKGSGISVTPAALEVIANKHNQKYLETKRDKLNHALGAL